LILRDEDEDLLVEIGSAKWSPKATAAGSTVVAVVGLAAAAGPIGWAALAGGMGARWWLQYRLSDQTISFLREMAPTHVRGA